MASNTIHIAATPSDVFAVLSDGWTYTNWVVGASHMRAVDADWPRPGARLHHAAGIWPMLLRDETEVEQVEPDRRLVLTARGHVLGGARVVLELADDAGGCLLTMHEQPTSGVAKLADNPVTDAALRRRNTESLARLAALVERRTEPHS